MAWEKNGGKAVRYVFLVVLCAGILGFAPLAHWSGTALRICAALLALVLGCVFWLREKPFDLADVWQGPLLIGGVTFIVGLFRQGDFLGRSLLGLGLTILAMESGAIAADRFLRLLIKLRDLRQGDIARKNR